MSSGLAVGAQVSAGAFRLDVRFQAPAGAITALFGPSGAGKSLTLDAITGVRRVDAGRISLDGRILDDSHVGVHVRVHERGIGLVFQDARLFPHLDVRGNLTFAHARAPATNKANKTLSIEAAAAHFDLTHLLDRRVRKLSGGEKARVALARAVLAAPDFLLLDEPFASLDATRRRAFVATLRAMHEAFSIPMLVVTYQIDDAAALATHLVGMEAGRVVAEGAFAETASGAAFRALLARRDVGAPVSAAALKSVVSSLGQTQWVRADHVVLAIVQPAGLSARNIWQGDVRALEREPEGSVLVHVLTGAGVLLARITGAAASDLNLLPGQNVWAIVKAHSL